MQELSSPTIREETQRKPLVASCNPLLWRKSVASFLSESLFLKSSVIGTVSVRATV